MKAMSNRFKFTKRKLETLSPSDKTSTFHDIETKGLKVTLSKAGTYTFMVYRKIQGRPERIKLGNFPSMTVDQARKAADQVNAQIAIKNNPNDVRRAELSELTLKELFTEYLELHSKPHKKSWRTDVMNYKNHLSHWDNRKLSHIKHVDIKRLHNKINKEVGGYQANRIHSLIRGIFYKATDWGMFNSTNPAKGIVRFKEQTRSRFLETDELQAFFKSVSEEENETIRDYVLISLLTGARRANVLSMEWKELNLDRAEWLIPSDKTKNGEEHTLPITNEALQILLERKKTATEKYVFPGSGVKGHLVEPKKGWARILKRAGIENLRLHDLRRSLGSWQAKTGASLAIIGKTLAHKDQKTTAIYARLDNDPVRESMEKATNAMFNAGSNDLENISTKKD
jgi:integrase